jgi:dTDP-4-dehydrorhamnose reductase
VIRLKVLVTGANGQLGYDLMRHLDERGLEFRGIDIQDCDLTDRKATRAYLMTYAPDVLIHCAAYTAVDKAESEPEICRKINAGATRTLAEACRDLGAKMVYISTDYVFGGEGDRPLEVDSPKRPMSEYGLTKSEGEEAVTGNLRKFFLVRTSWVFGVHGKNFIRTMLRLGAEKESVNVVNDQIGSPTYTDDLARLLCDMIETDRYGVYHATNEGFCSWAEFASAIMEKAGLPCRVNPIPTSEYPSAARRPLNSRLSKRSLDEAGFTRLPRWEDALDRFLKAVAAER